MQQECMYLISTNMFCCISLGYVFCIQTNIHATNYFNMHKLVSSYIRVSPASIPPWTGNLYTRSKRNHIGCNPGNFNCCILSSLRKLQNMACTNSYQFIQYQYSFLFVNLTQRNTEISTIIFIKPEFTGH